MKTVRGYLVKRGKTYYAEWTVGGQRFRASTKTGVKRDAQARLAEIMAPITVGDEKRILESVKARIEGAKAELAAFDEQANPPLTIGQAWPAYIAAQNRPDTGKATLAKYEIGWGRFWKWMKDNHPTVTYMRDVTPDIAGQFAAWLTGEGRSPNTFNKYMNLLALVFRTVKDKARLTVNPWEEIQRKKLVTHGRRELTLPELRKVTAAAQDDMRLLLALGIYTGLRLGDCATLRWSDVDLERRCIVRVPNKTRRSNPKPVLIPLYPTLAAMLAEIPEPDRTGYVLPRIASEYARHSSYVTDRVQRLFKACGIETTRTVEGQCRSQVEVGFHSLRHSFVSLCREANAPLAVVEAIVGHSNPAMTRHYTHTGVEAATAAISALPSMTGEPVKALPPADPLAAFKAELRPIIDGMTPNTWKAAKDRLAALVQ